MKIRYSSFNLGRGISRAYHDTITGGRHQMKQLSMEPITIRRNPSQESAHRDMLRDLVTWNVRQRRTYSAESLAALFSEVSTQAGKLFSPDAIAITRDLVYRTDMVFSSGAPFSLKDLSPSSNRSPLVFAQDHKLLLYVPDLGRNEIILSNSKFDLFSSVLTDCDIEVGKGLTSKFRSILVLPLYFSSSTPDPLGSMVFMWRTATPIDPMVALEPARNLSDFLAVPYYDLGSRPA